MSYYEDLGVAREATLFEIKAAHRRGAKRWHPDKPGGSHAAFQRLQRAYDVLSDPELRKIYDESGLDPRDMASVRERALQTLSSLFVQAIANEQVDVDHHDIVRGVHQSIEQNIASIPGREQKARDLIRKFERARKRLKKKTASDDLIGRMLDTQIEGLRRGIDALAVDKALGEEMLKVLGEYTYRFDRASQQQATSSTTGDLSGLRAIFRGLG